MVSRLLIILTTLILAAAVASAAEPRQAFIELAADKDRLYPQEQLVLTVRLYFRGNLVRGELSQPEHPHASIEQLGQQQESNRYHNGQRYRVVERHYAVFPQQPGTLSLDPIRFQGQARDNQGRIGILRDSARLFDIDVRDIPDQFPGDTWLPASNLTLTETGLPDSDRARVGESLTRNLSVQVAGLPAEAIATLEADYPDGLRAYPEPEQRETATASDGVTGTVSRTIALVATRAGEFTLPGIRIHWWDTDSNEPRVATLPPRTLTIEAAPGATTDTRPATDSETDKPGAPETPTGGDRSTFWPWLSLALALGWLTTAAIWWYRSRRQPSKATRETTTDDEAALFRDLCAAARAQTPATLTLLPQWLTHITGRPCHSAADAVTETGDDPLRAAIRELQEKLYGRGHNEPGADTNGQNLEAILRRLRSELRKDHGDEDSPLPAFYPPKMAPRSQE